MSDLTMDPALSRRRGRSSTCRIPCSPQTFVSSGRDGSRYTFDHNASGDPGAIRIQPVKRCRRSCGAEDPPLELCVLEGVDHHLHTMVSEPDGPCRSRRHPDQMWTRASDARSRPSQLKSSLSRSFALASPSGRPMMALSAVTMTGRCNSFGCSSSTATTASALPT